jgi:signal transduction histidine kinase/DNA-binding LacI/PurR family transcriptional regulator
MEWKMTARYPAPSDLIPISAKKASRPTIGVFKNNYAGNFTALQWNGLSDAVRQNDVNLICYSGGLLNAWNGEEREAAAIYKLVSPEKLDGIIIWSGNLNWCTPYEKMKKFIKSYTFLPVVSVEVAVDGVPSLVWDDFEGMGDVIAHLIEVHHCQRIAFIIGNTAQTCMEQRYRAYVHTLDKYHIPFDPALVWSFDALYNGPKRLEIFIAELISAKIDAIAACNDGVARMLLNLMQDNKLPELPVVGFDDEYEGRAGKSALTTVRAPFYKIGFRAVEVLLQMIEGRPVNERECVPCSMVVRRSCGCNFQALIRAGETLDASLSGGGAARVGGANWGPDQFAKLVNSLANFTDGVDTGWAEKLLTIFMEEARGAGDNLFIPYLETLFEKTVKNGEETDNWESIILNLHVCTIPYLRRDRCDLLKAENLLLKAMILIAETAIDFQKYAHIQENFLLFRTNEINQILSDVSDLKILLEKIERGLNQLGVRSAYIALYEKLGILSERARLILAYDAAGPKALDPEKTVFVSKHLLPDGFFPSDQRYKYILKPLLCQKRQIGFAVFEASVDDLSVYELVGNAISAALNNLLMINQLENQAAELSKANVDLESAYQSLKDNQQKLLISEKMASLGRLTAGIAHEMNTPLAAVRTAITELSELVAEYKQSIGSSQVTAEDHLSIAADMDKHLKIAEQAAEKSAGFIRGIKAQTIDMKFTNLQLFNAAFVITDALNILEFAVRKGHCQLVTNFDDSILLYGDPRRLVQVVTNLVMNSIEACKPAGGTITVKLTGTAGDIAELTVADTGCGIPEDIIARIFDPMFTTKPFGEGTGLGLSIVHDLVNEYKGSIKVQSQKGLTAFHIMLPIPKKETDL